MWACTLTAPDPDPNIVTRDGSPPNLETLTCISSWLCIIAALEQPALKCAPAAIEEPPAGPSTQSFQQVKDSRAKQRNQGSPGGTVRQQRQHPGGNSRRPENRRSSYLVKEEFWVPIFFAGTTNHKTSTRNPNHDREGRLWRFLGSVDGERETVF